MTGRYTERGSPFAPHTPEETAAMLETIGVDDEAELFDVPDPVQFDGDLGIEARSERAVRREVADTLGENDDAVELLGRGHYGHYVPSIVDHLSDRSEFLTSYTQYQPEITQGFLQVLFEYQSMIAEITGLAVANCSMYDAATALGEAATLSSRVRETSGTTILVPELLREERRAVLDNYVAGGELTVETYPHEDGIADVDALEARIDDDVTMVYAETPTVRGTIEESVGAIADLAHEHDALCTLGSDPVALSLLEEPAAAGVDVVVGNAAVLGLPTANGMGMGLFATSEDYVRQVPGRLVGASADAADRRTYTLTLQTREQHIRKERATSNICTNQAWVALRAAMHAATLGPAGLAELANESVERAAALAERVDDVTGVQAPVHDRHHCREFVAHTDQPARAVAEDLADEGYLVHTVGDHELQVCVTGVADEQLDDFVATLAEVAK